MKIAIGILLIVFSAICTAAARELQEEEVKLGLGKVNYMRRTYFTKYGSEVMEDLKYDKELEKAASGFTCQSMFKNSDSEPYIIAQVISLDKWENITTIEEQKQKFSGFLNYWTDKIGCSIFEKCSFEGVTYAGVCLLQPKVAPEKKFIPEDEETTTTKKPQKILDVTAGAEYRHWSLACMILAMIYFLF